LWAWGAWAGFKVWGWDEDAAARQRALGQGLPVAAGLADLAAQVPAPRRLLLSLPAGEATAAVLRALQPALQAGDLIIDAANARYQDSQDHAAQLAERGVAFVDAGVSGGVFGAQAGYCIMAGGGAPAFAKARPLLHACAAPGGLLHVGGAGEGHRVKTVHNGIEYGLMQAYAEGFELLQRSGGGALDLAAIARLWGQGAVVRSWLLELAGAELAQDPGLDRYEGRVGENSTGRWAAELAQAHGVAVPALQAALEARARSRQAPSFGSKLLSGLRARFGGHSEAA
jgi:6-phosphogluconate dehydrogenase